MLHHLDATLTSLVRAGLPPAVDVRLGPPEDVLGESVSLFLHRIEEDVAVRASSWTDELDDHGRVVGRAMPSRRYRFCYLVTACAATEADRHALLGGILIDMAQHLRVPAEHLPAALRDEGPVDLDIAHPGLASAPVELWAGLGLRPRTCLDVVLTTTITPTGTPAPAPPSEVDLGVGAEVPAPAATVATPPPRQRIRE